MAYDFHNELMQPVAHYAKLIDVMKENPSFWQMLPLWDPETKRRYIYHRETLRSKYMPHQGKREKTRRLKQLYARKLPLVEVERVVEEI